MAGIKKTRTTLHHTQGNSQREWFNRTLLGMLGTLDADEKNDWPEYVLPLVHAYNCIRHSSTGYSPCFLMFGHTLRFPINVSLGVTFENGVTQLYTVYAENLCTCLQYAHDLAVQNAQKKVESNKKRYDAHTSQGKNKLKDRWEDIPYLVTGRVEDLPVYVVQQEGTRKKRTLHCNLLLPYHVPHETLHTTLTTAPTQHQVPVAVATCKPSDWLMSTLMEVTRSWSPLLSSPQRKTLLTLVPCPLSLLLEKNKLQRTLPQRKSLFLSRDRSGSS